MELAPATPHYLPTLLAELKRLSPLPFDYALFSCILLCLVAGDKHLLLRTKDEDINAVGRQATNILFSLFGFPTHRLKVRPEHTVDDVIRGLFLVPPSAHPPHTPHLRSSFSRPRRGSGTRPTSAISRTSSGAPLSLPDRKRQDSFSDSPTAYRLSIAETQHSDSASVRAIRPRSGRGLQSIADDAEFGGGLSSSVAPIESTPKLPHAIVISGLESASSAVQMAVWDVLRTRRVVIDDQPDVMGGVWNLPDKFIFVCVSPLGDGRERPPILKCLIDRLAYTSSIACDRSIHHPADIHQAALVTQDHLEQLQNFSNNASIAPYLSLRVSSLLTATRHHPQLDGSLLSSRCTRDVLDFVRAAHTIFGGTKQPIVDARSPVPSRTGTDPNSIRSGVLPSARHRVPSISKANPLLPPRIVLDVGGRGDGAATAFNVDSIFRNVVGHRVRVRDGPGDEILGSLATRAEKEIAAAGEYRRRTTVPPSVFDAPRLPATGTVGLDQHGSNTTQRATGSFQL